MPPRRYFRMRRHHQYSMASYQKGPTRHAYAWQIGPFWQDTLELYAWFAFCSGQLIRISEGYPVLAEVIPTLYLCIQTKWDCFDLLCFSPDRHKINTSSMLISNRYNIRYLTTKDMLLVPLLACNWVREVSGEFSQCNAIWCPHPVSHQGICNHVI